jgi:hypothetical protein
MRHCKLRAWRARVRRSRWVAAGGTRRNVATSQRRSFKKLPRSLVRSCIAGSCCAGAGTCTCWAPRSHASRAARAAMRGVAPHAAVGAQRAAPPPPRRNVAAPPSQRRVPRPARAAAGAAAGSTVTILYRTEWSECTLHYSESGGACAHARSHAQPFFGVVFAAFGHTAPLTRVFARGQARGRTCPWTPPPPVPAGAPPPCRRARLAVQRSSPFALSRFRPRTPRAVPAAHAPHPAPRPSHGAAPGVGGAALRAAQRRRQLGQRGRRGGPQLHRDARGNVSPG